MSELYWSVFRVLVALNYCQPVWAELCMYICMYVLYACIYPVYTRDATIYRYIATSCTSGSDTVTIHV